MIALSLESEVKLTEKQGQFDTYKQMAETVPADVRDYFRKYIECIQLEITAEKTYQKGN